MIHSCHIKCGWLAGQDRDVYSQFGEDGLVDAILARIGIANRWAFECGAADGVKYSNTARFANWRCVLMESDPKYLPALASSRPAAMVVHGHLGPNGRTLDDVLFHAGAPLDIDLVVIDIDGQDYWVVHDMNVYTPRVLVVETQCPNHDSPPPERGDTACRQAGRKPMYELLESKGYTPIVQTDCNVIAVRSDLTDKLEHAT
jgi:hypothetical protein